MVITSSFFVSGAAWDLILCGFCVAGLDGDVCTEYGQVLAGVDVTSAEEGVVLHSCAAFFFIACETDSCASVCSWRKWWTEVEQNLDGLARQQSRNASSYCLSTTKSGPFHFLEDSLQTSAFTPMGSMRVLNVSGPVRVWSAVMTSNAAKGIDFSSCACFVALAHCTVVAAGGWGS